MLDLVRVRSQETNQETQKHTERIEIHQSQNHKPWPFEPVKVNFCFLRGPLIRWTAAQNGIVSWLLNFRIRMFVKSAVSNLNSINDWNPESKFHWKRIESESSSTAWNPESETVLDSLTWGDSMQHWCSVRPNCYPLLSLVLLCLLVRSAALF